GSNAMRKKATSAGIRLIPSSAENSKLLRVGKNRKKIRSSIIGGPRCHSKPFTIGEFLPLITVLIAVINFTGDESITDLVFRECI
ncbi:unnamed protein product, partial [marine sediment metagenome]